MNNALTQNFEMSVAGLLPDLLWDTINDDKDPLLEAIPPGYSNTSQVKWDQYEDPYGILPMRGLDMTPDIVNLPGTKTYFLTPGYYGAKTQLRESELTLEREPGTIADPLVVGDRLGTLMYNFSTMVVSRFRQTIGNLLLTGQVINTGQDGQRFGYSIPGYQTFVPNVSWKIASATPITDLLGFQATLVKGTSSRFGKDSTILMNSNVLVDMFNTTQVQATYKGQYGSSIIGLEGGAKLSSLNDILQGFDLPRIVRYDYGYYPDLNSAALQTKSSWNYIIPNQSMIWVGTRPANAQVGMFQLTRHAGLIEEGDAKKYPSVSVDNEKISGISEGLYVRANYHNMMPHHYDLELGFNGSPVLWYGSAACGISYS